VLLLDEPLSNLDARLRKDLRIEFLEIHRKAQITTVFVTHDLEDAFSMSDRVAVMRLGKVEQSGTPLDIYTRPRNVFVADFVGHTNVFEGMVRREGGALRLVVGGVAIDVDALPATASQAVVAVPSHKVKISRERTPVENCFEAVVKHVSFLGSTLHVVLEIGTLTLNSELQVSDAFSDLAAGDRVFVAWSKNDSIVLP
jgi:ABC-type Fe3+/spermidine/putrescine transport system ATPase subunit